MHSAAQCRFDEYLIVLVIINCRLGISLGCVYALGMSLLQAGDSDVIVSDHDDGSE